MTFTHALSTNRYGEADLIVSTSASNGTHTTLASAMAAAVSGQTIFLRDSVTENVTLTPGVNLTSFTNKDSPQVSITGKLTMTGTGTCKISNILLQTNSDFFLAVTGSNASVVNIVNCYLNCTNNTGISFTTSNGSANIQIYNCNGNLATTGITYFVSTSPGFIAFFFSGLGNGGSSTTASTTSSGLVVFDWTFCSFPVSATGTGIVGVHYGGIDTSTTNTTALTTAGTSAFHSVTFSGMSSGTASIISIGAGTTVQVANNVLNSSNANILTGAGTVNLAGNVCVGSSSGNNVNTINHLTVI